MTFVLAGSAYAVPLGRVREVVGCRTVVRVPNANECLRGVMNLRGSVVPVVDLARRLGLGDATLSDTTCAVVMETEIDGEHTPIAGLVDEIRGTIELADEEITAKPAFGTPGDARLVLGVASEGNGFAWVLDLDELLLGIT